MRGCTTLSEAVFPKVFKLEDVRWQFYQPDNVKSLPTIILLGILIPSIFNFDKAQRKLQFNLRQISTRSKFVCASLLEWNKFRLAKSNKLI